jgi:hypothetical protein
MQKIKVEGTPEEVKKELKLRLLDEQGETELFMVETFPENYDSRFNKFFKKKQYV